MNTNQNCDDIATIHSANIALHGSYFGTALREGVTAATTVCGYDVSCQQVASSECIDFSTVASR